MNFDEYQAGDLTEVVAPLVDGRANAVFGVRTFQSHTSYSFLYVVGNWVLTLFACALFTAYLRSGDRSQGASNRPPLFGAGLRALVERHGYRSLGWHSVGKTSTVRTLLADVSRLRPGSGVGSR